VEKRKRKEAKSKDQGNKDRKASGIPGKGIETIRTNSHVGVDTKLRQRLMKREIIMKRTKKEREECKAGSTCYGHFKYN